MCTIIFANQVFGPRIVVASNRDEDYDRSFSRPRRTRYDSDWVVAPRDERGGGTWIGFNADGLFVSVSNLPYYPDTETRSRGLLCEDVLETSTVEEARRVVEESLDKYEYDGFNLLVASGDGAFVAVNEGSSRVVELEPGVHVVTNSPADDPDDKSLSVLEALPSPDEGYETWIDGVKEVLRSHEPEVCVHGENWGTTSSNIVSFDAYSPDDFTYLFARGHPCKSEYDEPV